MLEHPGWTFEAYDKARAGDLLFLQEVAAMLEPERKVEGKLTGEPKRER